MVKKAVYLTIVAFAANAPKFENNFDDVYD